MRQIAKEFTFNSILIWSVIIIFSIVDMIISKEFILNSITTALGSILLVHSIKSYKKAKYMNVSLIDILTK